MKLNLPALAKLFYNLDHLPDVNDYRCDTADQVALILENMDSEPTPETMAFKVNNNYKGFPHSVGHVKEFLDRFRETSPNFWTLRQSIQLLREKSWKSR